MLTRAAVVAAVAFALGHATANAQTLTSLLPQGSLVPPALGQTTPLQRGDEPPLLPTPSDDCGPGSRPAPGIQGRVVGGSMSAAGYTCNAVAIGQHGVTGGYKVERYVDAAGHVCAYYDTTLLFPLNALSITSGVVEPVGTAVLDISDPSRPVRTATLLTPAMLSPHESLLLNQRRGLLAAVMGTPITAPGFVDLYDVSRDCRHPRLLSTLPVGLLGHESGFADDGRTLYTSSVGTGQITAVDVSNPRLPLIRWIGSYPAHGVTVSPDGNRLYIAARGVGLIILDVSEIQARKLLPRVREISRLTWNSMTVPQVALPVTIDGHPYLVEIDEFAADTEGGRASTGPVVGAGRIIDIGEERKPRVISHLRLAVHQPENREAIANDPGTSVPFQGYSGHYCGVPRAADPGIVACSMIASGLRVFDVRDPHHPREAAYYVAPPAASLGIGSPDAKSNWAMSRPAFDITNRHIFYSDANNGFHALEITNDAWP